LSLEKVLHLLKAKGLFKVKPFLKAKGLLKVKHLLKARRQCRLGLLSGHANPTPKDLQEPISVFSPMEPYAVQPITLFTLRNVDQSAMALCGSSLPPVSAIAAPALCAHSVKKTAHPPSNRDGSALFSGPSLPPPQHPMSLYPMSLCLLAQCFGEIGSALRSGDDGSICCARKPFCLPLARLSPWRERRFNHRMGKPEHNGPIGGSVGSTVSLAMLAPLPLPHLCVTIHGLPVWFAQSFGFDVVTAA